MGLMFCKKLEDMTKDQLWLWRWYEEIGIHAGYKGTFNHITLEYSLYSPFIKDKSE